MSSILAKRLRSGAKSVADELSDEDLLNRYLSAREPDAQEAFRELVVRHGPMVLGVCRHVLDRDQDAEDAFQSTFLVLARQGATIRDRRVLSGWLHEVAYRIALRLRAAASRRRALERQGMAMSPREIEPDDQGERAAWNELRPVLHEELDRLPPKYRVPVILSYLEGKTNEEVAELLQWPVGTVKGRLSRARELLRSRLSRRGLALSAAFLVTALSWGRVFAEIVPSELVERTVERAFTPRPVAGGKPEPAGDDPGDDPPSDAEHPQAPARGSSSFSRIALLVSLLILFSLAVGIGSSISAIAAGGKASDVWRLRPARNALPLVPVANEASHCR